MSQPYHADERVTLWHGDCLQVLRADENGYDFQLGYGTRRLIPDGSVDAVVTDPPYGLEFMGRDWDAPWRGDRRGVVDPETWGGSGPYARSRVRYGGTASLSKDGGAAMRLFQSWCTDWAVECLRVLKPGGMIAAFGGTRTFHRLACAIEDAGFEIRDSIGYGTEERPGLLAWAYGSGFPKSLNVTKALEALPTCSCSVASLSGEPAPVVEASIPPSSVGARAGAEAGAMSSARSTADETVGVGPQVVASRAPDCGVSDVDTLDVDGIGQALPVVLRPSSVAGAAEGQEVVGLVGGVKVNPESLRDQMVGEEPVTAAAIDTLPVTPNDCGCNVHPASPLVFPLATTPGRVAAPRHEVTVGGRHTGAGAVDATVGPAAKLISADDADVDAVPLTLHASHSTPERMVRCEACGGIRGEIPQGLGTALKPAWEPIVLARKPLAAGTVAANVLEHGTGALNIDACRVDMNGEVVKTTRKTALGVMNDDGWQPTPGAFTSHDAGRWPTNVVLDGHQADELDRQSGETTSGGRTWRAGEEDTAAWRRMEGRPTDRARASDYQRAGDTGGASRFFPTFRYNPEEYPCSISSDATSTDTSGSIDPAPSEAGASSSAAPAELLTSTRFRYEAKAPASERPKVPKRRLRLRDDLTPDQVDHVRARLAEAGVQVD